MPRRFGDPGCDGDDLQITEFFWDSTVEPCPKVYLIGGGTGGVVIPPPVHVFPVFLNNRISAKPKISLNLAMVLCITSFW